MSERSKADLIVTTDLRTDQLGPTSKKNTTSAGLYERRAGADDTYLHMGLAPAATASISGPAMLLLAASASPPRVLAPRAAAAPPELTVRPARWPDDYDAVCAVRKPTEFVVESGGAGFMGQKVVIDDPEEAHEGRERRFRRPGAHESDAVVKRRLGRAERALGELSGEVERLRSAVRQRVERSRAAKPWGGFFGRRAPSTS